MRCVVCDSKSQWKSVDEFRIKPQGMCMCNRCGFISYPSRWKSKEEIKTHYRKTYRNPPSVNNYYTGERKLYFHRAFLKDVFEAWKISDNRTPQVTEIGAAYGMALAWIKDCYPGAQVSGTELTTSYRRNAYHEFGINLSEEFDDSQKYDLIMSYKVAEHQLDIDQELHKYADCLKNNGVLYISVPTWFDSMCNFGMQGFDIEYYYDPNHINVWTRKTFEQLLKKAGLEVIRKDYVMYDSTYLCKKNLSLRDQDIEFEDPKKILENLNRIKSAFLAFTENKYDEAIALWPDYPTAHINRIEMTRKQAFEKGWEWIKEKVIEFGIKSCPTSTEMYVMACDLAMRAERFDDAINYAQEGLKLKPENPTNLNQLVLIMREKAQRTQNSEEKFHYFNEARSIAKHLRQVSSQHFREATDMIYLYNSQLPMPDEVQV